MNSRNDFPILATKVYGRELVYLDNAATTQKPRCVIDAMSDEYLNLNANVHRGVHYLSQRATDLHEASRETVRQFLGARSTSEIIFTRGTTESINLVATCMARMSHDAEREVIVTAMEHHSNIVSWQLAGFRLRVIDIDDEGNLLLDNLESLITPHTHIVSVAHVSNVLGTINPLARIIATAHSHGIPVLVDAAQSAPHMAIDVQQLGCDFLCLSGHKMYGPTGIGVLWGSEEWLDRLPPYMGGGDMIKNVSFERTTYAALPYKFEAGTPDYVATTGLAAAIRYITDLGMDSIAAHEADLTQYAMQQMATIDGMRFVGTPRHKGAVISFLVGDIHHLDMGTLLDRLGIAVRTGHHCAEPLMHRLGIEGTVRASFALYNTRQEIDILVAAIRRVQQMF